MAKDDETPDRASYMRAYRQNNPGYAERARKLSKIRQRAAFSIAYEDPIRFAALVRQMCEEEGIEPPQ